MPTDKLPLKYKNEIWCNEILLLAYYIATINIEHAYHSRIPGDYVPFEGAVLTDTFQMYEEGDPIDLETFVNNTERILREMETPIHAIVGNPPYSIGQRNENDNNANQRYQTLDSRIASTYVESSNAKLSRGVYDMYVRAFRWASDRLGDRGIIAFVTNAGWLDAQMMDGFRKCLTEEFASIYVFNLRGNARTQGEQRQKERDNVFGQGTRTPICISILVKNPISKERGAVHYHDIGDYLDYETKLSIVASSVIQEPFEWETITPDKYGDWLNQRDDSWYEFAPIGLEKLKSPAGIFDMYSLGVVTSRDSWAVNFAASQVRTNMQKMIRTYNAQLGDWAQQKDKPNVNDFIDNDPAKISWSVKSPYAILMRSSYQTSIDLLFGKAFTLIAM